MSIDSPVTVPGGTKTLSIAIPLADDDVDENEETFTVTIATTTEGWIKAGPGKDTAVVAIADDDNAGVGIIGVNAQDINQFPLRLNASSTYRVVLTSRPVADVTIKTSSLVGATVSPASHTFAARSESDWKLPKEFTVTGVRAGATAITHTLISVDRKYASLADADWDPLRRLQFYVDPPPGPPLDRCASRLPANAVSVAGVEGWRDAHSHDAAHVLRWNRVLAALGEDVGAGVSAMTVAEARANQSRFMGTRWTRVTATLEAIETCLASSQQQSADPAVSLSASPNPVAEGSGVRVTATLSSTLSSDVTVPLSLSHGTAEDGDYGSLAGITIPAGFSSATGTIATSQDGDADDETFAVALGTLPSGVAAGSPSSVTVTIADDDTTATQTTGTLLDRCASNLPANAVSVAQVEGWRDAHAHDAAHVLRWNRVLAALGEDAGAGVSAMTASEARANVRRYSGTRWRPVAATLEAVETCLAGAGEQDQEQEQDQETETAATPEVSISAGNAVTEGGSATFTLTASPAPASPLTVDVRVTQSGGYAAAGTRQVTVPAGGTASFTVATVDDAVDEPDGSVTATLAAGAGYTVSSSRGAATVAVTDNDDPAPATPEVSISAGNAVTEGESATFTLTASPAPASALTVGVRVTESGGYAAAGTRQVTVPTGGTASFTVATLDDAVDEPDGSVTATLAAGAGYTVSSSRGAATVAVADDDVAVGLPNLVTPRWSTAREGPGAAVVFTVRLSAAAAAVVTVDYATADGARPWRGQAPAKAGADYTAASGTLSFAAGETEKAVRVAILDDSIDEGGEHFLLRFSNPRGAALAAGHRESVGLIRNSDPLQAMWLARFGRMVASDAVASVTARLETPRDAGSHVTVAGQRMNFGEDEGGGGAALATVLTGLAQTFGAPSAPPADEEDPFARHGLTSGWNDPVTASGARRVTGRELLLGTSYRAVLGEGAGSQWTSWGQGASVSRFSAAVPGLGLTGESATGSMGMDYERGRLLLGFAMTHSAGEGTASDAGWRYALGSTATMMLPYARIALTDRISAWGLAGTGSGQLTLDLDGAMPQSYRTDLAMTLAAAGVRGDLVTPAEAGGFALALKADAFWVRTESDRVTASAFGSLMGAQGESSRVRAVLDGSRTFALAGGGALTPSLELGVRHDAGDAETGTGLEIGTGLGYADPSRGLDMALRVHGLAVHAEEGYEEWGVSGQLRLVPGGAGRGLSASLTPSYGVDPEGSERLWALPASSGLAANPGSGSGAGGDAAPSSRLDAELGYGLALWGDRFTGTPNVGFGLSEAAREYRIGWRLNSAVAGDPGFEVSLDATRREAVNDNAPPEHGAMLRSLMRW